jgi:hypothetical protein
MRNLLISSAIAAACATGCYSEADVGYSAGYGAPAPALVEVSPGIQVISDYDYPVFYANNYYWRYDGGVWYRSGWYNRGWAVSYDVPVGVRGIARPEGYVHYRGGYNGGGVYARDHRAEPVYRGGGPAYRPAPAYNGRPAVVDHRAAAPVARPAPAARPVVRDHRH